MTSTFPTRVARGLRLRGVEVITATEAGLLSASDDEIAAYALSEGFVVFTQDDDFLKLAATGTPHTGIVYSKQDRHSLGDVVRHLKIIAACLEPSDMEGTIEYY